MFLKKVNEALFFKPIRGEIDGMYNSLLDTLDSEKTVDEVCGPGGSLGQLLEEYEASVEKVKSYQTPDKGKDRLEESSSSGDEIDDEDSLTAIMEWAAQRTNTVATSDCQTDSGESAGRVRNSGFRW
jgi:hypothetical protein